MMANQFTPEQRRLLEKLWSISEEAWSAGWMDGIEFEIWKIMNEGPTRYGHIDIRQEVIEDLRRLSNEANGWIYWDEIEEEKWVSISLWQKLYQDWAMKGKNGP